MIFSSRDLLSVLSTLMVSHLKIASLKPQKQNPTEYFNVLCKVVQTRVSGKRFVHDTHAGTGKAHLVYRKNCILGWGHVNGGSTQDEELNSSLTDVGPFGCWSVPFCGLAGCLFASCLDGSPMAFALFRPAVGPTRRALIDGARTFPAFSLPWHDISPVKRFSFGLNPLRRSATTKREMPFRIVGRVRFPSCTTVAGRLASLIVD